MRLAAMAFALLTPASIASAQEVSGDPAHGAAVFKACAVCHFADQAKNKVGPSLQGVVGRPVASVDGYAYTDAMQSYGSDGKAWDVVTLSHYLVSPRDVVPGTRMSFPGLKSEQDIADVVAYLANTSN